MAYALVTGASVGIGRALALECARGGFDVVLVARTAAALDSTAQAVRTMGRRAELIAQDLAEPSGPVALYEAVKARGITIDVLVNNAGFGVLGLFWDKPKRTRCAWFT